MAVVVEPRPQGWLDDPVELLIWGLAAVALAVMAWLLVVVLSAALATLPGRAGAAFTAVSMRVTPAAVLKVVALALGTSMSVGAIGAAHASAQPRAGDSPAVRSTAQFASLDPAFASGTGPRVLPDVAGLDPAFTATASPPAVAAQPGDETVVTPVAVDNAPGADPQDDSPTPTDAAVVVKRGDTLWGVAREGLREGSKDEPSIGATARATALWYAANRSVIGDDPDLILVGQRLVPPAAADSTGSGEPR